MPFDDNLAAIRTPQRLMALCRLVTKVHLKKRELQELLVPSDLNQNPDSFTSVFKLGTSAELLTEGADGLVILNISPNLLENLQSFRTYIADQLSHMPERTFTQFTCWYIAQGRQVFAADKKQLIGSFIQNIDSQFNDTKWGGWSRWFVFLGYGYIHRDQVIPNSAQRLRDVLLDPVGLKIGDDIPFSRFMSWLNQRCPELDHGAYSQRFSGQEQLHSKHLSVGLSAGLRALHDNKEIVLNLVEDAKELWQLHPIPTHERADQVSSIQIRREVNG